MEALKDQKGYEETATEPRGVLNAEYCCDTELDPWAAVPWIVQFTTILLLSGDFFTAVFMSFVVACFTEPLRIMEDCAKRGHARSADKGSALV